MSVDIHTDITNDQPPRPVRPAIIKGIKCRCPKCGEGELFKGWLKVAPSCAVCGEELHHEQAQDFPPYITIMIVGHILVTLIMLVESNYNWSLNTHLMIWIPLSLILSLGLMQPVKGGVVGMQWAFRMFGFDENSNDG